MSVYSELDKNMLIQLVETIGHDYELKLERLRRKCNALVLHEGNLNMCFYCNKWSAERLHNHSVEGAEGEPIGEEYIYVSEVDDEFIVTGAEKVDESKYHHYLVQSCRLCNNPICIDHYVCVGPVTYVDAHDGQEYTETFYQCKKCDN